MVNKAKGNWKKWGLAIMVLVALIITALAWQRGQVQKEENKDSFMTLRSPSAPTGQKEVVEFFWYGCNHCYALEPKLEAWKKTLPADVRFRRVHVIWPDRSDVEAHARIHVALQTLKLPEQLHRDIFDAIQRDGIELRRVATLEKWVTDKGVDGKKFMDAYGTGGDDSSAVARLGRITMANEIHGVPAMVVNGKYLTNLGMNQGDPDKMLKTVDELLKRP